MNKFSIHIFIIIICFMGCKVFAQENTSEVFAIKSSDNYYWGEGNGETEDAARQNSKTNLIQSIVSNISSSQEISTSETSNSTGAQVSSNSESRSKAISRLKIKNLRYITSQHGKEGFTVLASIRKDDYQRMVEEVKTDICEYMKQVELKSRGNNAIDKLITDYYTVYLKTFFCPDPIGFVSMDRDTIKSLAAYLESIIRTQLSTLFIKTLAPIISPDWPDQIEIPIEAVNNDRPVNRVVAHLSLAGNPERLITDGRTNLILNSLPSANNWKYKLILTPDPPTTEELIEIHKQCGISETREVNVNFSKLVSIDFSVKKESENIYAFQSKIKNLSISKIEWDFGDGSVSSEENPKHIYGSTANDYIVKLRLNGNDELSAVKSISDKDLNMHKNEIKEPDFKQPEKVNYKGFNYFRKGETYGEFMTVIDSLKDNGTLVYGRESDFKDTYKCYIIFFNNESRKLEAILEPGKEVRNELYTNQLISDYKINYKGMRAIWIALMKN